MLKLTEITGIRNLVLVMIFSAVSYLMGRIFYVPPKYCYVDKVGFRTEQECKSIERLRKRMPDVIQATTEASVQINLWYYEAWKEFLNEQSLGCREYYLSFCGYEYGYLNNRY